MRKSNKNTNKACMGCRIPDWWDINGISASCWEIDKFFNNCPCKQCLVKVTCINRCKERNKLVNDIGWLNTDDVTAFRVKRRKRKSVRKSPS
jgi:hypothetical protein